MGRKIDRDNFFYYTAQPIDQQIGKRAKKVTEVWKCWWCYRGKTRIMTVVAAYLYDGGSIPRIAWSILGITPSGPGDGGFLPHDVLFRAMGGKKPKAYKGCTVTNENGNAVCVPRVEADWVMYEGLRRGGIAKHRCRIAHAFVRTFGRWHWGGPMPVAE